MAAFLAGSSQVGEHEGSVRDARGAAESISSYVSALSAIQVHPELDGRSLGIVHSLKNDPKPATIYPNTYICVDGLL